MPISRSKTGRFLLYALMGAFGTGIHYAVMIALVETGLCGVLAATSLGALAGAVVNYLLNFRFTFAVAVDHRISGPKFACIAVSGFLLNALLMQVLAVHYALPYLLAQVVTTLVVLVFGYVANARWTFKTHAS
jgi:putative flippase GtrA